MCHYLFPRVLKLVQGIAAIASGGLFKNIHGIYLE